MNGISFPMLDEDSLPTLQWKFLGKIANLNGEAIWDTYTTTSQNVTCDYVDFLAIQDIINTQVNELDTIVDPNALSLAGYVLDALQFEDAWYGCQNLLSEMMEVSETYQLQNSTTCIEYPGTPAYDADPCCNYLTGKICLSCINYH
jgi:hypothetical protein